VGGQRKCVILPGEGPSVPGRCNCDSQALSNTEMWSYGQRVCRRSHSRRKIGSRWGCGDVSEGKTTEKWQGSWSRRAEHV